MADSAVADVVFTAEGGGMSLQIFEMLIE